MPHAQRTRRAVILGAVAGVLLTFFSAAPASAHAALLVTDPVDGAVLDSAPDVVTLTFNEPVTINPTGVGVLDAAGTPLPTTVSTLDTIVEIDLPAELGDGSYIVTWQVVSPDSHPIGGAFTFSIGAPTETVAAPSPPTSPPAVTIARQVAQGAVYVGTLGATGLITFTALLAGTEAMPRVRRRLRRTTLVAAVLAILGMIATVPLTTIWQSGLALDTFLTAGFTSAALTSETAVAATIGTAGLLLAVVASGRGAHGPRRRAATIVSLLGAATAVLALVLVGHTRSTEPAALVLGTDALHLITGAVWFGGLIGLGILLSKSTDASPPGAARTLARFSMIAAPLVAVLAVTGTFLGWRIIGSLDALVSTGYGQTLLVKIGLAVAIVAIGAWNRSKLRGIASTGHGALRRTVRIEGALLVVLLLVTGVLVSQSPRPTSITTPAATAHGAEAQTLQADLGEGSVEAVLSTDTTGAATLTFTVLDHHGRPVEPVTIPDVNLSLPSQDLGPLTAEIHQTGTGAYESALNVPFPGRWEIAVSVRTSTYDNPIATLTADIGTRS